MTDTKDAIATSISQAISGAQVFVDAGSSGHFTIRVVAEAFRGKGMVESQRLVYSAIAHLMKGDQAPVHAVDKLTTQVP